MRYSHPSIFPSLWDVPISLSHSNNKTQFFFSFLESEIHAKTIEKSNKIQETERREGLRWWFSSSKSERPSLLAVYYGIQGIIGYSNSLELQVQLCLSLSLSLSMLLSSLSSFPLCFSLGKQLNFGVCISEMRQKDCQVNNTTPNYFFTLLLNQFEIPTNLIFFPIFLPFQLFLFASYLLLHVSI